MKIAMTADPELPIPPKHYGGIERVIHMLVEGLVRRGHEVVLFANPESRVNCKLIPYAGLRSNSFQDTLRNMRLVHHEVTGKKYDLIHSHGRLMYLLGSLPMKIPKIMTYQREISPRSVILGDFLSRGTLHFTAVSHHLMAPVKRWGKWAVIHNGVPAACFTFSPAVPSDAPLVFLGRIEHVKGTHLAVEVAKKSGRRLVIAGNIEPAHQSYYDQKVKPYVDGTRIKYVGPVDDAGKNELLGGGVALLMPVQFEDPCPVVLSETLACGTPVIGLRRGAIPEIIQDQKNGFVCDSVEGMADAVGKISQVSRKNCRESFEKNYSDEAIVSAYETLYRSVL